MLSVKPITRKGFNELEENFCFTGQVHRNRFSPWQSFSFLFLLLLVSLAAASQDNSPYSRYGLGDQYPRTNIVNRGMGGISAGYLNRFSINFTNPASYAGFEVSEERGSKKLSTGRVILDIGVNLESRTLREANNPEKFTSPNTYFSYIQLGVPIRKNWGLGFGLRPMNKISYQIERRERLFDPNTNMPIDSAVTEFIGDGGAFLANLGTGFAVKNFSIGANIGYLFGKKDYSTRRTLINDTVQYNRSNHQSRASFGDLYMDAGFQYKIDVGANTVLRLGAYGSMKQEMTARRDFIRETFTRDANGGDFRLDSVSEKLDEKGIIVYPAHYGAGLVLERTATKDRGGYLIGIDYVTTGWDDYRFYGQTDAVRTNSTVKIGGQIKPAIGLGYWNFVEYRAGVSFGKDYVYLGRDLKELGFSFGMGLPVLYLKDPLRRLRTQQTLINISMEYIKRGNNQNLLKEDLFRFSLGFSLSDFWFTKRKYD